jgi:flavin-dependent dehydrogenase
MLDMLVIGGGPAGASLAARLAAAGASVALVEKSAFPRAKVCGEYLAPNGVCALAEIGVQLPTPAIRRIALWADQLELQAPLPMAGALTREVLDTLLLEQAAHAGAKLWQPAKVCAVRELRSGYEVFATRGITLRARAVVAAHGSWESGSLPTQCARSRQRASDLFGFKAHLRAPRMPAGTIALVPFAGGYGGALALGDGRATFACAVRRDALRAIRAQYPRIAAGEAVLRHALQSSAALGVAFGGSRAAGAWLGVGPLRPGMRPLRRGGIFAVGNAAGEVHPIVGEGITLALHSAAALADALLASLGDQSEALRQYKRRYRGLFALRLWRSSVFATLATSPALAAVAARALRRVPPLLTLAARV